MCPVVTDVLCWERPGVPPPGPGLDRRENEPMKDSNPTDQVLNDRRLIEDLNQVQKISLGEEAARCHVCDSRITPGQTVVVFVYRPAGASQFRLGYCLCDAHKHEHREFRRGRRELVVTGRVGECIDHVLQASWPVLVAPEFVAVSDICSVGLESVVSLREDAHDATPAESGQSRGEYSSLSDTDTAAGMEDVRGDDGGESYGMYCYHGEMSSSEDEKDEQDGQIAQDGSESPVPSWTDNVWELER